MILIYRSEGSASLRRIPIWLTGSDGTTAAAAESGGQPQINWVARGTATVNTAATLSLISANAGEYFVELNASEVSALGVGAIHYRSANAIPNSTYFQVVNFDSGDSMRLGQFALPNAAAAATGGLLVVGTGSGAVNPSLGSVGLVPFDYSSVVTVGVGKITAATYSGVTISGASVTVLAGDYGSSVTFGVSKIAATTYSGVTIDGVNRVNSSVTPANATYSAVTVRLDSVDYSSAVTVGIGKIAAASYSGVTVEVSNIAQSARSLIADDLLLRSIAAGAPAGRTVQDALRTLRNRVLIGASIGTVFSEDDSTSAWTFSISTTATNVFLTEINPAGGSA